MAQLAKCEKWLPKDAWDLIPSWDYEDIDDLVGRAVSEAEVLVSTREAQLCNGHPWLLGVEQ